MQKNKGRQKDSASGFNSLYQKFDTARGIEERLFNLQQYLSGFSGYDPNLLEPRIAGGEHSLFLLRQLLSGSSVVFEPSIESKGHVREELERSRTAAEAFASQFSNLLQRVTLHTELCKVLRALREIAEASPNRSFFRAIVDIHDCTRASDPEEMKEQMAKAICKVINGLSPHITNQELYCLNEELFTSGLRPWPTPKIAHKALKIQAPEL